MIAWTPPESERGLGSVLLSPQQAQKPLTREAYRTALAARIDRLIKKEDAGTAQDLLLLIEDREPLRLVDRLETAAETLAEYSQTLARAAAFPPTAVQPPIKHEPETAEFLAEETLEEFVDSLLLEHQE